MADQPELLGGNQNDQAARPSAANQNNQLVQLSADKNKKRKKPEADKKYHDRKKQKTENMLIQNEKLKADYAELEKKPAYTTGKLDQLKEDMEQTRETLRIQKQMVETQNIMINMLQQHLQLPFEMPQFDTGEIGLPVHHPPVNQPGTTMVSGDPAVEELLGLPQSHLPRGGTHGDNVEQPAFNYGGYLSGSLDHLNNTYPPGTGTWEQ